MAHYTDHALVAIFAGDEMLARQHNSRWDLSFSRFGCSVNPSAPVLGRGKAIGRRNSPAIVTSKTKALLAKPQYRIQHYAKYCNGANEGGINLFNMILI